VRRVAVVLVAVLAATGLGSCANNGGDYRVSAEFTRAVGVYPGAPVRVLGIDVGSITDVTPVEDRVMVTMDIDQDTTLPADATATIVPVSVLGERYVQLGPVYDGGPALQPEAVIPVERTAVPAEIDELLRGLQDYLGAIEPANASALVTNLAQLLEGQGEDLNHLIENAAGTFDLLADKSDELSAIVDSLAELTESLGTRTETVQALVRSYDVLSGTLAANRDDIDAFVTQLDRMSVELAGLLTRHQEPLQEDVEVVTTVGRTLVRNLDSLDRLLEATPRLFAAAGRAYDPVHNWLPLNNQTEPTTTSQLYLFRIRDRLAGICRRLAANMGAAAPAELILCGDAASGFFDQILGLLGNGPPAPPAPPQQQAPPAAPPAAAPAPAAPAPTVTVPPVTLPPAQVLLEGLELLRSLIQPDQAGALDGLGPELLEAIDRLTPEQLQALARLTPEQLAALRSVDPDQLAEAVDNLIAGTPDPSDLLDQTLLPPLPGG
jgi:phospholipid/cholesterol/gamma-HCH transport system substrate-binding protein